MRTSLAIKEQIAEVTDAAQALSNIAAEEKRELTPEEKSKWDEVMDSETGTLAKLDAELATAEKFEAEQERLVAARTPRPTGTVPVASANAGDDGASLSMPKIVYSKLHAFKDREHAWRSGIHLAACLFNNACAQELCQRHGLDYRATAHTEGSNFTGGYLVLPEFEQTVLDLRQATGVFRGVVPFRPMASDTQIIPRRATGVTAYAVGENATITESNKTWDQVEVVARKWGVLCKYSSELGEDAFLNLADDLASEMAYAFSEKEDASGFIGDGSTTYHGISGVAVRINDGNHAASIATAATGNTGFSSLDLADFEKTVSILPEYPGANVAWHIHKVGFYLSMSRLAMAAGGNTTENFASGSRFMFLGYPVIFNRHMNSATGADTAAIKVLLGDLSQACTAGERRGLTVSVSTDRYFELDQIGIKATTRWGIAAHSLGDGSDAGPVVALKTPAS